MNQADFKIRFRNNLIKSIFLFIVSVFSLYALFTVENSFALEKSLEVSDEALINSEESGNFFNERSFFRVENSLVDRVELIDFSNRNVLADLKEGRFWFNFLVSDLKVNLKVGNIVLIPQNAVFDLSYEDGLVKINVFEGDLYLGFVGEEFTLRQYYDEYSDLAFLNKFLVPKGSQVSISMSVIDSDLRSLLYSKLVKEFKFFAIPESVREEEWVLENLKEDKFYLEDLKQSFLADVIERVNVEADFYTADFVELAYDNLTFLPNKKEDYYFKNFFSKLDALVAAYLNVNQVEIEENSIIFRDAFSKVSPDFLKSERFVDEFYKYFYILSLLDLNDPLLKVREIMLENSSKVIDDDLTFRTRWLDVYKSLSTNLSLAQEKIENYNSLLLQKVDQIAENDFVRKLDFLTYQNLLYDNLLLRFPIFYQDKYFSWKSVLEKKLLDLYPEGQLKQELEQFYVSNKIAFLKRLQRFFFENQISISDADQVLKRLIAEARALLEKERPDLAVLDFFEQELTNVSAFGGYLNDPSFNTSSLYGNTHSERFEAYLEEEDLRSYLELQKELFGEQQVEEEISLTELDAQIVEKILSFDEVTRAEVLNLENPDQIDVEIRAVIGGYAFTAIYNRSSERVKEVKLYDEIIVERLVDIDSLLPVFKERTSQGNQSQESVEEDFSLESSSERLARVFVADSIKELGLEFNLDQISVLNSNEAIYRIEESYVPEIKNILFTFTFDSSSQLASEIIIKIGEREVSVDQELEIGDLVLIAEAEGDVTVLNPPEPEVEAESEQEQEAVSR